MQYPPTELVLDANGNVYHLGLSKSDIADTILLVGDQDRVDLIASFFDTIEHSSQHREFVCKTGTYNGKRITALSTGIGTDNIDITINELDAIHNINSRERKDNSEFKSLNLIRIGTCGILNPQIPVLSYILSTHAYGLDNVAHFYDIDFSTEEIELNKIISSHIGLPSLINTYLSKGDHELFNKLYSEKTESGITITSSGFYGPQGRQLRLKNRTQTLNENLSSFQHASHRISNFEMESSALFSLGKALGHRCATICLGIANRANKKFASGFEKDMMGLIQYVLERI
ncbi:nucleoside phosphorylase [Crocinitomicaceae bacterium]|nr:nucleoside phosphorylase [Crocinitomicaceae bacterium]